MFPEISYLSWIDGRPEAATHDLASSDLRPDGPDESVIPGPLTGLPAPAGERSLERRIADRYDVSRDSVLVTPGATAANVVATATALGSDGDRVVVETPGYEPHHRTPEGLGATVDRFDRPREEGYALTPDRVESVLCEDTALVLTTNRHNPTGVETDRSTLGEITETVRSHEARLLVDEVYGPYASGGTEQGFGGVTAAGLDDAVAVGSLTKFHGLGGLRVGWLVADEPFVERARETERHFSAMATPSRALGRRALANASSLAEDSRALTARNHDLLVDFLDGREELSGTVEPGCPYGLVTHESLDGDELAATAETEGVLVVPGRFFEVPEAVRVSLGRRPGEMDAALSAFGVALDG